MADLYDISFFCIRGVYGNMFNVYIPPTCEHVPNVDIFYFNLTCDVIGDPEVNKIKVRSTTLKGLSNVV